MPFITPERRQLIDQSLNGLYGLATIEPGDRCYVFYKEMVEKWKAEPRWTTAHSIYRDVILLGTQFGVSDDAIARELAWQVFFNIHVMHYEQLKRDANGDIE
jgi:hypothetical protein